MRIWLYNQGWQRFKWKDLKTSNDETHVQVDVGGVGAREGIALGWSQGFGFNELNVSHECWWWINLWLINW